MIGWLASHQLLCLNLWKCSHTKSCLCEKSGQTPPQLHSALITYWKGILSAPPMTQYSEQNFLFWSFYLLKLPRNFRVYLEHRGTQHISSARFGEKWTLVYQHLPTTTVIAAKDQSCIVSTTAVMLLVIQTPPLSAVVLHLHSVPVVMDSHT